MENIDTKMVVKIGIVVKNIEETVDAFQAVFGFTQRPEIRKPSGEAACDPRRYQRYQGKEIRAKLKSCIIPLEPVYLEVLEPEEDGTGPWADYLKKRGNGVCFISFYVNGFEQKIDFMNRSGFPAEFVEEKGFERYAYFKTMEKLGFLLEMKERGDV